MPNPVIHFEIAGRNGERLEEFYVELLGWRITRRKAGEFPYDDIDTGISGHLKCGIRHEPQGKAAVVL